MDFVLSAASPSEILAKLARLSIVTQSERSFDPAPGIAISYIGYNADNTEYSVLLRVPEDGTYDLDLVKTKLGENFNYANPPLRIIAGTSATQAPSWEAIKYERDRRKSEGGYQAAGKWFHSDDTSRIQQLGLVILGANIPAGLKWKTLDGSFVVMTPTLAQQIFAAAAASDMALFAVAEKARADFEVLPADKQATFDLSAIPWPPQYVPVVKP
jgi:hypothetical protein